MAQDFDVSDPRLELRDNIVFISYEILNSDRSERFIVTINISDQDGKRIRASALSGDIGEGVSGGSSRVIKWDLTADRIVMNSTIYVKVRAKLIPPPEPELSIREISPTTEESGDHPAESENMQDSRPTGNESNSTIETVNFSQASLMVQSLAFPGLGMTRVTGKPHWIKGVMGYGAIAGSVIMNRKAVQTYDDISDFTDYTDKDNLFQKSLKQDLISESLAYLAIGVWVVDLVWTWMGTKNLNQDYSSASLKGVSVKTSLDPLTNAPLVGVSFGF